LSDKDIERMIEESEKFAEADKERRNVIEEANKAESVSAETEKAMADFKDQIDQAEADNVTKLVADLRAIAAKAQAGDAGITADAIREQISKTQQASLGLFSKVYEKKNAEEAAKQASSSSETPETPSGEGEKKN